MFKIKSLAIYNVLMLLLGSIMYTYISNSNGYILISFFALLLLIMLCTYLEKGKAFQYLTYASLSLPTFVTILITFSLLFDTIKFFQDVSILEFTFSTKWSPYPTISDKGVTKLFGVLPLITGTLLVTLIATIVSTPLGILSAIYMSHYSSHSSRYVIKMIMEVLAGIPSVVYGYFAFSIVAPFIVKLGLEFGINIALESSLSAGLVMGVMIMPLVISLTDDVLRSVPKSLYYGALVLGSTRAEAIIKVIIPAAFPGIFSTILLAITRALGETMIVLMATGVTAKMTLNPLDSVTTVTVQIAMLLSGDQDFEAQETLSAYTLAFFLFTITWAFNAIAVIIANRK